MRVPSKMESSKDSAKRPTPMDPGMRDHGIMEIRLVKAQNSTQMEPNYPSDSESTRK